MKKITKTATKAIKVAKVAKSDKSTKKVATKAKAKAKVTAIVAAEPKKRGRPALVKVEAVKVEATKRGRPAKVEAVVAVKRGRKVGVKSVVKAVVKKRPAPVVTKGGGRVGKVMPRNVHNVLVAALSNPRVPAAHKAIINEAIKASYITDNYRFTALHDVVRQTVRNAALKVLRSNGDQLNYTARLFGIASANLKKWRDEETQGIHNIRARGRPEGKKNDYRTIIHKGKEIKVRIEDTEAVRRMSNGIPRTEYRLKKGAILA